MYLNVFSIGIAGVGLLALHFVRRTTFQPVVWAVYGLTSLVLFLFQDTMWTPIYMLRYFFYIISSFVMLGVPFILVGMALLLVFRVLRERKAMRGEQIFQLVMATFFLAFVVFTIWGLTNRAPFAYARFISIYTIIALYFSATFLSFVCCIPWIHFGFRGKKNTTLIVLGTEIGEDGKVLDTLKRRLDYALAYAEKQMEEVRFIVSGGARNMHGVTEADRMKSYLMERGIAAEHIQCEPLSRNTYENLIYSSILLQQQARTEQVLVITSKFHLVRTKLLADRLHFKTHYLGSRTAWYLWPYAVVREYIAFLILTKEVNYVFLLGLMIQGVIQVFEWI